MQNQKALREQICEIGRRLYARGFVAGNDGNISCRIAPDRVLCTPTLVCKGFMKPDELCVVDLDGKLVAGPRPRTSEILLHLEIYRCDPGAGAVVHAHPPHATAFAVTREEIPSGILPEVEVFLGLVPRSDYETPGGEDFARTIRPFVGNANTVLLSNHGTVSWAPELELAYWRTEILDSYCRVLMLARGVGDIERLPENKVRELLAIQAHYGVTTDPRHAGRRPIFVNRAFGRRDAQ